MRSNKLVVDQRLLKKKFSKNEPLSKTISRFIDNSIIAKGKSISQYNPCEISIDIYKDFISIKDNSGGVDNNKTEDDIFKLDIDKNKKTDNNGILLSFFTLGNLIQMYSNNSSISRKFWINLNSKDKELTVNSDFIDYDPSKDDGTTIYISDLDPKIIKIIENKNCLNNLIYELGIKYRMHISKNLATIKVNNNLVKSIDIEGEIILPETQLLDCYHVKLYKCSEKFSSGIEVFINNFMKYDKEEGKQLAPWKNLTRHKYSFKNCVVVVTCEVEESKFDKDEDKLFEAIIDLIKENKDKFKNNTVIIQFEIPIVLAEKLMEYFNVDSAKELGIKGVQLLNEIFKNDKHNSQN